MTTTHTHRFVRRFAVFALLALAALTPSCECGNGPPAVEGTPCKFNSDCLDDEYCGPTGRCVLGIEPGSCRSVDDCAPDELCIIPEGSDVGACLDPNECAVDGDCEDGKVCQEINGARQCVFDGCEDDAECVAELGDSCELNTEARCVARACVCRDLCGAPCGEGEQCCAVANAMCIDDPGPCSTLPCEPGFHGVSDDPGPWVSLECDYPEAVCRCEELPPLPVKDIGVPHVLAVRDDGAVFAVAYNASYGDVAVGSALDTPVVDWEFIDGVPATGDYAGGPSGPRGGLGEPGDDVGRMLDAAFAPDDSLHVVARDTTNGTLRHVYGPIGGPWSVEVLDGSDDAGFYPQIEIDAQGRILVAHVVRRTPQGNSEVRVIALPSAGAPSSSIRRYVVDTLDLSDVACEGGCPAGRVCPAVADDVLAVCVNEGSGCSCDGDEVCTAGGCVAAAEIARRDDALAQDHLALVSGGGFALFGHAGREQQGLRGVRVTGGDLYAGSATFDSALVVVGAGRDVGNRATAARATGGYAIAHVDTTTRAVLLTTLSDTFALVDETLVDDGGRPHPSGATENHTVDQPAVALGQNGSGVVAWQDGTDGSLRGRTLAADGTLGPSQILAGGRLAAVYGGNYGFDVGAAVSGTRPFVTSKRVLLAGDPATHEVVRADDLLECPNDDAAEPNDSQAAAAPASGGIAAGILCGNDDWYEVNVGAGCSVTAEAIFRGDDGDIDLELVDPSGTVVAESVGVDDDEAVSGLAGATADFALHLIGYNGAVNAYVLRVEVVCP